MRDLLALDTLGGGGSLQVAPDDRAHAEEGRLKRAELVEIRRAVEHEERGTHQAGADSPHAILGIENIRASDSTPCGTSVSAVSLPVSRAMSYQYATDISTACRSACGTFAAAAP